MAWQKNIDFVCGVFGGLNLNKMLFSILKHPCILGQDVKPGEALAHTAEKAEGVVVGNSGEMLPSEPAALVDHNHQNISSLLSQENTKVSSKPRDNVLRRRKRSFLWMFPSEKGDSGVPNRDYFNILANETIKLELEIVSIAVNFQNIQPVRMSWSNLTSSLARLSQHHSAGKKFCLH